MPTQQNSTLMEDWEMSNVNVTDIPVITNIKAQIAKEEIEDAIDEFNEKNKDKGFATLEDNGMVKITETSDLQVLEDFHNNVEKPKANKKKVQSRSHRRTKAKRLKSKDFKDLKRSLTESKERLVEFKKMIANNLIFINMFSKYIPTVEEDVLKAEINQVVNFNSEVDDPVKALNISDCAKLHLCGYSISSQVQEIDNNIFTIDHLKSVAKIDASITAMEFLEKIIPFIADSVEFYTNLQHQLSEIIKNNIEILRSELSYKQNENSTGTVFEQILKHFEITEEPVLNELGDSGYEESGESEVRQIS